MSRNVLRKHLEFPRVKTLELIEMIATHPDADQILIWRPGPGRAHIAWQLMHIAATDDRHLNARIRRCDPVSPEFVQRFAGGSTPDDQTPSLDEIRHYLTERRADLLSFLESTPEEAFSQKPYDGSPYTLQDWFHVWAWHEAHHHGQAHLTLNLYKALKSHR